MKKSLFVLCSFFVAVLLGPTNSWSLEMQSQAKIPLDDLRAMAGPWECHGSKDHSYVIWITSQTEVQRTAGRQTIGTQTVDIRVDRSGYFSLTGSINTLKLEDRHLVILKSGQFLLDVHFDPDKLFWKGIWTPCGGESEVKLERPASVPTTTLNPMVDDWQGVPGNSSDGFPIPLPEASSLIRIRQDEVGRMFGWAEWFNQLDNARGAQRYGDGLAFSSTTPNALNFELGTTANCSSCSVSLRFEGAYSPDRKEIVGKWSFYRGSELQRATTTTYQQIR